MGYAPRPRAGKMEQHSSPSSGDSCSLGDPSCQPNPPFLPCNLHRGSLSTSRSGPMSWSTMSRPTEDEASQPSPGACSVLGLAIFWPLSILSVSRSTAPLFFLPPPLAMQPAGSKHGQGAAKRLLAFRHKPPPAKARSEEMAPPSVEASGRGGGGGDWFETTHQDKPGRGFPSRASNALWPGGNPPPSPRSLPHTLSVYSNSNIVEHTKRSKTSRPPPE